MYWLLIINCLDKITQNKPKSQTHFNFTEKVVNKLLFLQKRRNTHNCATLVAAVARGRVAFWSFHQKGGLLGYFLATNSNQDVILSMDSDDKNRYLLIGKLHTIIQVTHIVRLVYESVYF